MLEESLRKLKTEEDDFIKSMNMGFKEASKKDIGTPKRTSDKDREYALQGSTVVTFRTSKGVLLNFKN